MSTNLVEFLGGPLDRSLSSSFSQAAQRALKAAGVEKLAIKTEMAYLAKIVQEHAARKGGMGNYPVDVGSLRMVLLEAATVGMSLSPSEGLAYAIPYWNKDLGMTAYHYSIGYRGIIRRAMDSGVVLAVDCEVVHHNDTFESGSTDDGPWFRFGRARRNRGEPELVFCSAKLASGQRTLTVMDMEQVKACEKAAKTKYTWQGPWRLEMMRKACVRRDRKYWPSNRAMDAVEKALQRLEPADFNQKDPIDGEVVDRVTAEQIQGLEKWAEENEIQRTWLDLSCDALAGVPLLELKPSLMDELKDRLLKRKEMVAEKLGEQA